MKIGVFTLFPEAITSYCATSILGRAQDSGALSVDVHDLRDGAGDARRTADDSPFGGGAGMVLMAEPVFRAVEQAADVPRPLLLLAPAWMQLIHLLLADLLWISLVLLCAENLADK